MSVCIGDLLPKLEEWKRSGRVDSIRAASAEAEGLKAIEILQAEMLQNDRVAMVLRTRRLIGAPLNIPFTDLDDVLSKVSLELDSFPPVCTTFPPSYPHPLSFTHSPGQVPLRARDQPSRARVRRRRARLSPRQ